jgi:hypothetical protein
VTEPIETTQTQTIETELEVEAFEVQLPVPCVKGQRAIVLALIDLEVSNDVAMSYRTFPPAAVFPDPAVARSTLKALVGTMLDEMLALDAPPEGGGQ